MLAKRLTSVSVLAVLRIVVILFLGFACFKIIQPFLGALIWAAIIAISTWPLYENVCCFLYGRRKLAAVLLIGTMSLALATPIFLMIISLKGLWPFLMDIVKYGIHFTLPEAPAWLISIPLLGGTLHEFWLALPNNLAGILKEFLPFIHRGALWSLSYGADLALSVVEIILALFIAGLLLVHGHAAWQLAEGTIIQLGGAPATDLADLVARTIRGVTAGVIGTALAQTLLCLIGFMIASVPAPLILSFLCFLFAVAQLPTLLVWLPAAAWVFYMGQTSMAIFLTVWGFVLVNCIDNVLKPFLISQGAKLPLSVIFMGVIGGLIAWGVIGLFIGPALLAVGYTLFVRWLDKAPEQEGGSQTTEDRGQRTEDR